MDGPTDRRHALLAGAALAGCASGAPAPFSLAERMAEVRAAEIAFAKTMADRDLAAFASFVAEEAVFINAGTPLRGKAAVVEFWKRFYQPGPAPFSWRPEIVEVAATGDLGYSEGPVTGADGRVAVRYASTWRRSATTGRWQVVFDNGYPVVPRSAASVAASAG
jgi:ketosteroid isomerase-like protein